MDHMVKEGQFGIQVPPDDPQGLADAIRWAAENPAELDRMGLNGRKFLEDHYSSDLCIGKIEEVLRQTTAI